MADDRVIVSYLHELRAELRVPRRLRERVLAEADDHLRLASVNRTAGKDAGSDAAQHAAIAAFGSADVVATRFAQELAVDGTHRATRAASGVTVAFCVLFALSTQVPTVRAASPFASGPAAAIAWLAVQIAFVCAALSWARSLRHRDDRVLSAEKLRWILRGDATALGFVAVSVCADLLAVLRQSDPVGAPGLRAELVVSVGAVAVLAAFAIVLQALAHRRLRALARVADEASPPSDDALSDLATLARRLGQAAGGRPGVGALVDAIARAARRPAVRRLALDLNLRRHPWRLCLAVALCAGVCTGLSHDATAGLPPLAQLPRLAAVAALLGSIEALAVIVCFALLGGFLGIRRPEPGSRQIPLDS